MVALTSTLEPTAVQTLIEKMEAIRDSIKESIRIEEEAEAKNARDTDTILAAIFNAIESLTREKSGDEEALQETIRNRDIQDKRARDAHAVRVIVMEKGIQRGEERKPAEEPTMPGVRAAVLAKHDRERQTNRDNQGSAEHNRDEDRGGNSVRGGEQPILNNIKFNCMNHDFLDFMAFLALRRVASD